VVEAALARLDEVCSRIPRPAHFTDHPHCDECFEADQFFRTHTPVSLAAVTEFPETLPIAFLTDDGFRFMLPGLVRLLERDCRATDLLVLLENRVDAFTVDEAAALRDVLYTLYDVKRLEFDAGFFAYETLSRVLERLDLRVSRATL
jgi:hypothetical protein